MANVRRDTLGEVLPVDSELLREPGHGLVGRPRLAALDLRDVLLREASAGELRLREAGCHAEGTQPLSDSGAPGTAHGPGGDGLVLHPGVTQAATRPNRSPPLG